MYFISFCFLNADVLKTKQIKGSHKGNDKNKSFRLTHTQQPDNIHDSNIHFDVETNICEHITVNY